MSMKKTTKMRLLGIVLIFLGVLCGLVAYKLFRGDSKIMPILISGALVLPIFGIVTIIDGKFPITTIGKELSKLSLDEQLLVLTGGNRLVVLATLPSPLFVVFGVYSLLTNSDRSWYVWVFILFWIFVGIWIYRAAQRYVQKNPKYGILFGEMLKTAQFVSVVGAIVFGVILYFIE